MRVTRAKTRTLRTPADNPLVVGVPVGDATREFVTLELDTDEGVQGIGLTFAPGTVANPLGPALRAAVDGLCELVVGQDPMSVEAVVGGLRRAAGGAGPGGIFTLALSAIDVALWDIKGKALGQSVCSLLGGYRDRVPTYASGALMRPMNLEYLAEAGPRLVEMGFKQMKTQMGAESTPEREVARIRVMREGIGPHIDLMCDINQLWNDYQGLARVADALTTPIAAGEYVYGITPFRQMLEARSIDIVMIDLLRVGGITQWRKVAGMAEAFNLPVVSHLVPEIHIQLMAAIPNGLTVEYMPWTLRLFEETPEIVDGEMILPNKPGLGLKFSEDAFKQYQVS